MVREEERTRIPESMKEEDLFGNEIVVSSAVPDGDDEAGVGNEEFTAAGAAIDGEHNWFRLHEEMARVLPLRRSEGESSSGGAAAAAAILSSESPAAEESRDSSHKRAKFYK